MRHCPNLLCSVRGTKRSTASNSSDSDNNIPTVLPSTFRPTLLPPIPEQRRTLRKPVHAVGPLSLKSSLQVPRKQNDSALSICNSTQPSWRGELTAYSKISKSVSVPRPFFAFSLLFFFFISYKPTAISAFYLLSFDLTLAVAPPLPPFPPFGVQY
jgi:hypothetical protein